MKRLPASLIMISASITFLACGGGGGGNSTPAGSTQSTAGIWTGTSTNGSNSLTFIGLCDSQGNFRSSSSDNSVDVGQLTVTGATFAGTGEIYNPAAVSSITFSNGIITTGISISGQWSGGGESGALSATFDQLYNRPVTLASLAGSYVGVFTDGTSGSLTLQADGTYTSNPVGSFSGSVTLPDTSKNLFSVTYTNLGSNETLSGLGFWADSQVTSPLTANTFFVQVTNASYGVAAVLVKQ